MDKCYLIQYVLEERNLGLSSFNERIENEDVESKEIFKYIYDDRMKRVLFESKIFKLRKIQKEAIENGLFFRKSFLVCAPSGSGKTLIGELCAVNNVFHKYGKSIYLVPFKALATEKYSYFKKSYEKYKVKTELSIGDYEADDEKLSNADIIVTTYEKMDSILRNSNDKEWIFNISTIIIDEIHIIGDDGRGARLESLIVRLNEFLHKPQIIGLSATISNPEFFNNWLNSLGNKSHLIISHERPVPLHYQLEITQNKDSTIKKIAKTTLEKNGQLLIFVNKRKTAQQLALSLRTHVKKWIEESALDYCKQLENNLDKVNGGNSDLRKVIGKGVAFHHAGLLPKERKIVERAFKNKSLKIICCTTTLSAGLNLPARTVIVKDFKRYITTIQKSKNLSGFYELGDGFSYFLPFLSNTIFQMLGRAGRPGLDSVGYGIILVRNIEEKIWIEDHYFKDIAVNQKYTPRYNDLESRLNKINTLQEQVLLRIYEEKNITIEKIKNFFKKTYFWFSIEQKNKGKSIPIDQFLLIKQISPSNILKLHSQPEKMKLLQNNKYSKKLSKFTNSHIAGHVKTDYGVYRCQFDIDKGIICTCGFENRIGDNFATENDEFSFIFCDHITIFLMYLIQIRDKNFQKYVNKIVPRSIKHQYILNYLLEKGLILINEDNTIKCSQFGKLIIRLYLYPTSGVLIREKLENDEIYDYKSLVKQAYEILKTEGRVRDNRMLNPLLEWIDEEPIDGILERYKILGGDLYSVKEQIERIILFILLVARFLSETGIDMIEKMNRVVEIAETLGTRVHYGIKTELFDLVIRVYNVGRVRARILYDAGFHTASQIMNTNPYVLNHHTKLGVKLCKKLIQGLIDRRKKHLQLKLSENK